jgi:hypothetical protein
MNKRILAVGAALVVGLAGLVPSEASACSCMRPSLSASYHYSSDTIAVRVLSERQGPQRVYYRVEVVKAFSGCLQPGDRVTIETPVWSASCGQRLATGARYLLTADAADFRGDPDVYSINLCGYNRAFDELTAEDMQFLRSRSVFCEETGTIVCSDGTDPVQCLQDPCQAEAGTCEGATICESNTCGGCNAEFYGEQWAPMCEDTFAPR